MNNKMILLIEDNLDVQNFNRLMLEEEGFYVETVMTLAEARSFLERRTPDIIILDIGMPDGSGLDFLCEFRQSSNIPVLLLTGFGDDIDVIKGYEHGCNDYLPKPYTFGVLLARIKSLLQSAEQIPDHITRGALFLDVMSGQAFINDHDLLLSQKEFALLLLLIQNEGKIISAEYIYKKVWGQNLAGDKNAVQVAVSRLRIKLEPSGLFISIKRNIGYKLIKMQ